MKVLFYGLSCLVVISIGAVRAADTTLIPAGSTWKYLDDGSDPGGAVRGWNYDDTAWLSGPAQLGYGDDDEVTVVDYGLDENNKHLTTFFRHYFVVVNAPSISTLTLRLLRDDGALVYLNGEEVFRSNMPPFPLGIDFLTPASSGLDAPDESTWVEAQISPSGLREGVNLIMVEVHQASPSSSDLSFDLELIADASGVVPLAELLRGPYLQSATPTNVLLRWRTSLATNAVVRWGTAPADLVFAATNAEITTEHIVPVSGLQPETKYWYSVGTIETNLARGEEFFFVTGPRVGVQKRTRIWAIGDSGTASPAQAAVRDAYYNFAGSAYTDVWLMLGDNAYGSGYDHEYQAAVFDMYPTLLRQTVLWSAIGNHETYNGQIPLPYFQIFSFPTDGAAGGVGSGTEAYYSFDYANIHFVVLDSMTSDRSGNGSMAEWLRVDLENTMQDWIIALWHHPPYTKGSHNSDTEQELIQMRENIVPILEDFGVDLVLTGHSHCYERSYFIDGHYGSSDTFNASHVIDGGNGREDSDGAYLKAAGGPGARGGAVYAVAGSSGGQGGFWQLDYPHEAMFYSVLTWGSLVIDIETNRLDAVFLSHTGSIDDRFTIIKNDAGAGPPRLSIIREGPGVRVTWPVSIEDYVLESVSAVAPGAQWMAPPLNLSTNDRHKSALVPASEPAQFFRLRKE